MATKKPKKPSNPFDFGSALAAATVKKGNGSFAGAEGSGSGGYNGFGNGQLPGSSPGSFFGPDSIPAPAASGPATPSVSSPAGLFGGGATASNQPAQKTFADYLAEAQQYVPGGTDYGALMDQERSDAGQSDARIAAMYKQLQGSYASDGKTVGNDYSNAKADVQGNGKEAAAAVNQAYQGSRDAQTAELAALGIGDAAGVLASAGGNAANDQARTLAAVAQNSQGNQNNITQHKATALDYNTNIKGAAGLEGNLQRAVIQKQLQDALANLEVQQSSANSQKQSSALQIAQQLQSQDALAANGGLTAAQQSAQDIAYAKIAAQAGTSKNSQSAAARQNEIATYSNLLKQYDGDDSKALAEFKQLKALGLLD